MDAIELVDVIREKAPRFNFNGEVFYIVERDRKVAESHLPDYASEIVAIANPDHPDPFVVDRLVVATINGKPMRWKVPTVLGWSIDEASFAGKPDVLERAKDICKRATADWNSAAERMGIADKIRFEPVSSQPTFRFIFENFPDPGLYAFAFFPNDPVSQRFVHIGPATFADNSTFDAVGVIRHELGHVLGFRHEHIRAEAQDGLTWWQKQNMEGWVVGNIGGKSLDKYDSQSVMHYPINNRGTNDFKLTDLDIEGFRKLYSMPSEQVHEYPV